MRGTIGHHTVAFIDILGFKEMVYGKPINELAKHYEYNLLDVPSHYLHHSPADANLPTLFPDHPVGKPFCTKHVFSDSIILISLSSNSKDCLKLLMLSWRLSQSLISIGFPVRGGISFGEMYNNFEERVFLGKALTQAYELEQKQNWIGVSIEPELWNHFPDLNELVNGHNIFNDVFFSYEVPLKDGKARMRTLNWRFNLIVKNGTRSLFVPSDNPSVYIKQQNTLKYAEEVRNSKRVWVQDQKDLPIELRSMWVGDTEPPFPHGDEL